MISNNLFVDTSWFKAIVDLQDDFYLRAHDQKNKILGKSLKLITTNYVLDESFTLIRVKANLEKALEFREILSEMGKILKIVRILPQDEKNAWKWFPEKWSKLSFTDCTSFAVMERLELKDVLTFDNHFSKAGFKVFK